MSTSLIDKQEKERKHHGVTLMQLKLMNTLAFILTIVLNYISSAGLISPYGVGTISRKYPTKITPASGAFAIWAYIYCLEALFVVYQYFWPKKKRRDTVPNWFLVFIYVLLQLFVDNRICPGNNTELLDLHSYYLWYPLFTLQNSYQYIYLEK